MRSPFDLRLRRPRPAVPETDLQPGLALVIPVWNDPEGLARLLDQARGLGCFAQIVVVDDGSDPPVPAAADVTMLRHRRSTGSGAARNDGLEAVRTRHVLFFDSDDLLTAELPALLADLEEDVALRAAGGGAPFDFCLFRHADSRVSGEGRWGQPDWDDALWARAGHGCGALAEARPEALPILVKTANYPWNKIYRTAFLRENGIGCGKTRLHQDIPLHWLGFLKAGRVLVSDRICAWHHVSAGGGRLTNRTGAARLEVFGALDPVVQATGRMADPAWRVAMADFTLGLTDWVATRIGAGVIPRLRETEAGWLAKRMGPWAGEIAALDPALADRLQARMAAGAGGQEKPAIAPVQSLISPLSDPAVAAAPAVGAGGGAGTTMTFLCLARGAGAAVWPLAETIAAQARPGDQVIWVDDGSRDDTRAWIGRFAALRGWEAGIRVDHILTATPGRGDTGIALNLGLDLVRGARILVLAGTDRLLPEAFAAARAQAEAGGADLLLCPVAVRGRQGQAAVPLSLSGVIFARALLAGRTGPLRADEGRVAQGDLALLGRLLLRAARSQRCEAGPILARPPRPAADPAAFLAAAADLLRAEPAAAGWLLAALPVWLAGAGQGVVAGMIAGGGDLARLFPPEALLAADPAVSDLLLALREGDGAAARALLRPMVALPALPEWPRPDPHSDLPPGPHSGPLAAPLPGNRPMRIWLEGPHTRRTPFAYPHLAALWEEEITLAAQPEAADLLICAHPRDLPGLAPETAGLIRRRPCALLSEEPFWDTLFSPDPLAETVTLWAGRAGHLRLHQVNHHRSAIFDFDRIPYFLLTEPGYIAAYARLFARNAARSAAEWQADLPARPLRLAFMAERRPERFHDLALPRGDILGLCAWRTRLAEAAAGPVERLGASWQGGTPRVALADWHGEKLQLLDGRVQILSALENTHQPNYLSEKLFDAFACGALPLYLASPGHRLHDLGLPEAAWVNLWGLDEAGALQRVDGLRPEDLSWRAYAAAQRQLAGLFGTEALVAAERARLRRAVLGEVARLIDLGPA